MDVLNFAHGGLFAWGAYSGTWIYAVTGSFAIGIIGADCYRFFAWLGDGEMDHQTCLWEPCPANSPSHFRAHACVCLNY